MINDLCILVCTYKRPYLIEGLLKSWKATNGDTSNKIAIVDNSPENDVSEYLDSVNVRHARFINRRHSDGVMHGLKLIKDRYVLILDSDIIFNGSVKSDIESFIESGYAIGGEYCAARGAMTHPRIHPWFCMVDTKQINDNSIKFVREVGVDPPINGYDTGSSFFEDIMKAGLTYKNICLQPSKFIHYEGMSWRADSGEPPLERMDFDNQVRFMHDMKRFSDTSIDGFYEGVLG